LAFTSTSGFLLGERGRAGANRERGDKRITGIQLEILGKRGGTILCHPTRDFDAAHPAGTGYNNEDTDLGLRQEASWEEEDEGFRRSPEVESSMSEA
jgi:hypothetical protein